MYNEMWMLYLCKEIFAGKPNDLKRYVLKTVWGTKNKRLRSQDLLAGISGDRKGIHIISWDKLTAAAFIGNFVGNLGFVKPAASSNAIEAFTGRLFGLLFWNLLNVSGILFCWLPLLEIWNFYNLLANRLRVALIHLELVQLIYLIIKTNCSDGE